MLITLAATITSGFALHLSLSASCSQWQPERKREGVPRPHSIKQLFQECLLRAGHWVRHEEARVMASGPRQVNRLYDIITLIYWAPTVYQNNVCYLSSSCHWCRVESIILILQVRKIFFFKILFILSFREGKGEKERKKNINVWLPFTCPLLGTCNSGMCPDWELNQWPFGL